MDDESLNRLGRVFPRVDVLNAAVRLRLSELLATPASWPAVRAEDLAEQALPRSPAGRLALRTAIENALEPNVLASLRALHLSDVVPAVGALDGGPLLDGCPARLYQLLTRERATTWAQLAPLTLAEMTRWTGVGPQTLAALIGLAIEAVLTRGTGPAGHTDDQEDEPHEPGSAALALVLDHDAATGGNLRRALVEHASGDGPVEVRAAASRLLAAADRVGDPRLALLDRIWAATGDYRDRAVLAHRTLMLDRRTSTKELAAHLGLSEARVGELRIRVEQRARDAASAAGEAIDELVGDLRARLGPVSRLAAIDMALDVLGLPGHDDPRAALLVWLAGPYHPVSSATDWLATDPATLLADTRRVLRDDGGVRQLDDVAADLEKAGMAAHDIDDWLRLQPVALVDGLVVTLAGGPADVAERILSATGTAMTASELAAMMVQPLTSTALSTRLERDPRFLRADRDHFELAEWGGEAFVEPPPPAPAELFPGAGRGRPVSGMCHLRIEVDAAVLRGASDPVPISVVEALGVPCGGRRSFTTRFGPVALSHKAAQPTRGSVRPIALAAGATEGDALLLEFDAATGNASVELVVASRSAAS